MYATDQTCLCPFSRLPIGCSHLPTPAHTFDLAGLYVPTSDVDLVVLNTKVDVQSGLKALARLLQTRNVATKMQARHEERVCCEKE